MIVETDTATTRYMYILTVSNGRLGNATASGTVDVLPGSSRASVFDDIVQLFKSELGYTSFAIVYFSLERDAL
ncbi:hypothetical protein ACIBG7_20125 [Nonomuraea sp. NPDC050328]|uniref:hypothetical protein n=1 Tax=Nonomuraea sp. NPDC050328 TaxID=3364361 RepID=UPI00379923E5